MSIRMNRIALACMVATAGGLTAGAMLARASEVPATSATPVAPVAPADAVFMTGADAIDPADYAKLPKVGKFRAWLPKSVDLTANFPKPGYQGKQSSCVAWATTYAARGYLYGRDIGRQPTAPREEMSPGYVYGRLRQANNNCQTGLTVGSALELLKREGAVTQADFPTDLTECPIPPAGNLQSTAASYRLGGWRAIDRESARDAHSPLVIDDVKGALTRGEPVVFVMPAKADWTAFKGDGIYTHLAPEHGNNHAMAVVGYDEDRQAFRVINSWGDWWGDHGYAWIGYPTFKNLTIEAYALQDMPARTGVASGNAAISPQALFAQTAANLPCGAVKVTYPNGARNPDTVAVSGFAGSTETLDNLYKTALAASTKLIWRVDQHPWPQCEAELNLADPLNAGGVTLNAQREDGTVRSGDPVAMHAGDFFGISASVDARRPYLNVVYLQADGSAVGLYQGMVQPDRGGRRKVTIGLAGARETRFQVGAPYGDELVIALATDRPLFGDQFKDYATERQFLSGMNATLARLPKGAVAAALLRLKTQG